MRGTNNNTGFSYGFYTALSNYIGTRNDVIIATVANMTSSDISNLKNGTASLALMVRVASNLYLQLEFGLDSRAQIKAELISPMGNYLLTNR